MRQNFVHVSVLPQHHAYEVQPAQPSEERTRLRDQDLKRPNFRTDRIDFWLHRSTRTTNKPRRMYPCGKCQKVYSNASSLYRHLKLECGMLPQFHCPYCRFSSKRKFNLDSHVAHRHSKLLNNY
ncbi:unnamed protein product, partial [Heterotrigona itama]